MNNPPSKPWAKLLTNSPEKESILLFSQEEELYEGQIKTGCQIYQKSAGDAWIKNLSASPIKIGDDWLEVNEEKEISRGETVSFNKDKENDDDNFDYVFLLMNSPSKNVNKRNREESLDPVALPPNHETIKLTKVSNELEQELLCSICLRILYKCATLHPCQHTFCSFCLLSSFKKSVECPLCRVKPISITKNLVAQNLVEVTLKNFPEKERPKEDIDIKPNESEGEIVQTGNTIYIGFYQNGKREGKGNLIYPNGQIYENVWQNGKREGKGAIVHPSGRVYKGQWLNDVVQNIDEIIFPDCGIYKGETKNFCMHGKGVFKLYDGTIYDGSFINNCMEGFGTMNSPDGLVYKGEWKKDKKEGEGVEITPTGERYEGSFMNDCYHGKGKYIWADGAEYKGDFVENLLHGIGTIKHEDGEIYEGQWRESQKEGEGVLTLTNGDKYRGTWKQNDLQSVTKVYYANGDIYEGGIQLENLQKHGEGVLTYKNGDKYEGNWLNDKQHGKGRTICNRVFEGDWEEGNMIGEIIMIDANGTRYKIELKKLVEEEQIENNQDSLEEHREINEQNS